MINKTIVVQNKLGLHARPCSLLIRATSKFSSEIIIKKDDMEINGKSIMGVMMLAAECGSELQISINGVDEEYAWETIENLFNSKFDEE